MEIKDPATLTEFGYIEIDLLDYFEISPIFLVDSIKFYYFLGPPSYFNGVGDTEFRSASFAMKNCDFCYEYT